MFSAVRPSVDSLGKKNLLARSSKHLTQEHRSSGRVLDTAGQPVQEVIVLIIPLV